MPVANAVMYLDEQRVRDLIDQANSIDEVIVVRCVRKGPASKPGGPDAGDAYDLHVVRKPEDYVRLTDRDRRSEDRTNGVLTVYVSNRRDRRTGQWGDWRRVNIEQVVKVIYRGTEYEVSTR